MNSWLVGRVFGGIYFTTVMLLVRLKLKGFAGGNGFDLQPVGRYDGRETTVSLKLAGEGKVCVVCVFRV